MLERQGNLPSHKTEVGRLHMEERPERKAGEPLGDLRRADVDSLELARPCSARLAIAAVGNMAESDYS